MLRPTWLMPHSIKPTLQLPLQVLSLLPRMRLLRPRILVLPRIIPLRNRHLQLIRLLVLIGISDFISEFLYSSENHRPHIRDIVHGLEAEVEGRGTGGFV